MNDSNTTDGVQPSSTAQALGFEADDFVTIATNKVQTAHTMSVEDLDEAIAFDELEQRDTWIGAQPVKEGTPNKRTSAKNIACIRVLYADFDLKDATDLQQILNAIDYLSEILEAQPWSIVHSGGGLHPRWKLEKPLEVEDGANVLKNRWRATVLRVAEECGFKADSVFDAPRVLRLPGTVNEKYSPAKPVTFREAEMSEMVPTRAVWANLDTAKRKLTAESIVDESAAPDGPLEPAPAKPVQSGSVISERYVNSELNRDIQNLKDLQTQGWDGPPWHNTVRDIAFRMAKIGLSPNTTIAIETVADMFYGAAPTDDDFGFDEHHELWESALERADGEIYEMIGAGDDIFADDFDDMLAQVSQTAQPKADIDPDLNLDDVETVEAEPVLGFRERYAALELPLVPGFGGAGALRIHPVDGATPLPLVARIQIFGEDISDMHASEHVEYLHPHCPACFPATWQGQLHRWLLIHRSGNPAEIHPPSGATAPNEGYVSGTDLLNITSPGMLIEKYLPLDAIGIVNGRGGAGKTFIVLDMILSILDESCDRWSLCNRDGMSLDDDEDTPDGSIGGHGPVMFLAGEGFEGFKQRLKSWLTHHGYGNTPDEAPSWLTGLTARSEVPNMFTGGEAFDALLLEVAQRQPRVVVVDTLQKAAAGSDQNSSSDMAQVYARLGQLKRAAGGATIIVIAHTTKDDTSTRGASSIEDDADFVLHVSAEDGSDEHLLSVNKQRDGSEPEVLPFYLSPVGKSVVVTPTPSESGSVTTDQAMIEVATGFHTLHSITSFDEAVSRSDVFAQVPLPKPVVNEVLSELIAGKKIAYEGGNKFILTPKGKDWIEHKSAALFAKSRGIK